MVCRRIITKFCLTKPSFHGEIYNCPLGKHWFVYSRSPVNMHSMHIREIDHSLNNKRSIPVYYFSLTCTSMRELCVNLNYFKVCFILNDIGAETLYSLKNDYKWNYIFMKKQFISC